LKRSWKIFHSTRALRSSWVRLPSFPVYTIPGRYRNIIPCWDNPNSLFSSRLEVICGIRISSYAPSQTFVHHTSTLFSCWQMMFFYVQWYCAIHAFTIKSHTIASAPMVKKRGDQIPAMKAADIKPASTPHWKKPIKMDYQAAVLFSWLIIPITVKTCLEFYVEHFEVVSAG